MAFQRISPWAEFFEERRASAQAYNDIRLESRQAFRTAQQDAYESWAAWDKAIDENQENLDISQESDE